MHDVNLNSPHGPQIINRSTNGGQSGSNGYTFIPQVSPDGIISWTNNGNLPNPEPVNIMGPQGPSGPEYTLTESDKQEIVQDVLASLPNGDEVSY